MDSMATETRTGRRNPPAPARAGGFGTARWRLLFGPRYGPWLVLAIGTAMAAVLWMTGRATVFSPASTAKNARAIPTKRLESSTTHFVAPQQLAAANSASRRAFAEMTVEANDGRRLGWNDLSQGRPVVLVFIKEGCPCNVEVEAYFSRVEWLYRDVSQFAGVIDAPAPAAREYGERQQTAYPVLADPEREVIHHFEARNGCYFALLDAEGVLDGLWPGCSPESLCALGRRIATLAQVEERPVDVAGIPAALITGCPFVGAERER